LLGSDSDGQVAAKLTNESAETEAENRHTVPTHFDLIWILFSLRGRLSLGMMWCATALSTTIWMGLFLLGAVLSIDYPILIVLCLMLMVWNSIAIGAKRFHDIGWPGWLILPGLIPMFGQAFLFITIGVLKGERGPNRYGPDPRRIWSAGMIDEQ